MKHILVMMSGVLILGLLTACGQAKQPIPALAHESQSLNSGGQPSAAHHEHGKHNESGGEAVKQKVSFGFTSGTAHAGNKEKLTIRIQDEHEAPVYQFRVNHEKLMHLIVVSRDLSFFNHIHPVYRGKGVFDVDLSFPAGGDYKLFTDFVPEGGKPAVLSEWVKVGGEARPSAPLKADSRLVTETEGIRIDLTLGSAKPNQDTMLTFRISDAKTGRGIDNLQPYLGTAGHVVILSADAEQYLHVHPVDEKATGPVVQFSTSFPRAGLYKIWGQFQHQGKVLTAPFTVEVK
ncbi:hypothetical protein WMW72_01635 [Paenibacillus filicis]|uniref:Secreted protein n=1 Tax=Paenibacillus filicis TaxID=669464 RepID=A0ABU9DCM8_9BACL